MHPQEQDKLSALYSEKHGIKDTNFAEHSTVILLKKLTLPFVKIFYQFLSNQGSGKGFSSMDSRVT